MCLEEGDYRSLYEGHGIAFKGGPSATNNVGEYTALAAALIWCLQHEDLIDEVLFRGDSQLVINQVAGEWRCRNRNLKPISAIVNMMVGELRDRGVIVEFEWISRKENKRADRLASKIINDALKDRMPLTLRLALEEENEIPG